MPEVDYFLEHFIPAFELNLDELVTIEYRTAPSLPVKAKPPKGGGFIGSDWFPRLGESENIQSIIFTFRGSPQMCEQFLTLPAASTRYIIPCHNEAKIKSGWITVKSDSA